MIDRYQTNIEDAEISLQTITQNLHGFVSLLGFQSQINLSFAEIRACFSQL